MTLDEHYASIFTGAPEPSGTRKPSDRPLPTKTCFIAMLPRTGSSMLCSIFEQTGVMGFPDEYLNPRGPMQMWRERNGSKNFTEYIDLLVREKSTDNGVFSLKATYRDAAPILGRGLTSKVFPAPRFVYLNRHDMIAQAVSGHKANSSGVWHRKADGTPYRLTKPYQEPVYDREEILKLIDQYAHEQVLWEKFFVLHQIKPLRLSYEDLCDNLQRSLSQIFEFMDVAAPTNLASIMSATKRLSDDVNQRWMAEFLKTFTL